MDIASASLLLVGVMAILAIIGVPIGLALAASGATYIYITNGVLPVSGGIMFSALDKTPVLAIPFFIIAAEILSRGGAIKRLVSAVDSLIGHLPGGLAVVAVISTIIFSAMCGSSIATAAAIGVVVLPELIKRGYPQRFSLGLIAMSGGLGILIPPSIPLIIYGLVSNESIGKLFKAGIVPGLLFGALLCAYVIVRTWSWRGDAPRPGKLRRATRRSCCSHRCSDPAGYHPRQHLWRYFYPNRGKRRCRRLCAGDNGTRISPSGLSELCDGYCPGVYHLGGDSGRPGGCGSVRICHDG